MTLRAATHLRGGITAFAPVASGDPYGWRRVCDAALSPRLSVPGAGFDRDTGLEITQRGACQSERFAQEAPWDDAGTRRRPRFRLFFHDSDGVNDRSCSERADRMLRAHGYDGPAPFILYGGQRSAVLHLWQDAYARPILEFFASQAQ